MIKKTTLLLYSLALLLIVGIGVARGQSSLDGFDPNANGTIRALVVQADGKILIGGDFTTLSPNGGPAITCNHLARLNPNGTVDTVFNPNANGVVYALAIQADGKILAGGVFNGANSIGGQARNFLARLDATNGTADSFNPAPDSDVVAIAVQSDGSILAGGDFSNIGGQTRNRLARLNAGTGLADSFNPNADSTVYAILVQADGKVLAGGDFNSIGGQARHHVARLAGGTGLADSLAPNANGDVYALAFQADGKILVGGSFFGTGSVGGQNRNYIARLDPMTGLADSFNPNANGQINALVVQADGRILAGGNFTGTNSIGGQTRSRIARLDPTTGLADAFDPESNVPVLVIATQPDNKILAGGQFTTLTPSGGAAVTRNHIARLEADGRVEQTLDANIGTGTENFVLGLSVQTDGKVLVGGEYQTVQGHFLGTLNRLNTDGSLDSPFHPSLAPPIYAVSLETDGNIFVGSEGMGLLNPTNGNQYAFDPNVISNIYAIAVQADGKVLVGGSFTNIGGQPRNHMARLDPTTGAADAFNPNADGVVGAILIQPDGMILVGGEFQNIGDQSHPGIARLDPASGLPDSFNPNSDGPVFAIARQPDGKILAGGDFTSIGGQPRYGVARLDPTTGASDSFNPAPAGSGGEVLAIALQADGKILLGGQFTAVGGNLRRAIARLDPVTGAADSFNPNPNPNSIVYVITLRADGKIFVGGIFNTMGGATREYFARLSNDTVAQQNLAASQNTVTWSLGGSSPQFTRVTFESSSDSLNYTPLGNGTPAASNWTLAGLNLPTSQNLYLRARGYYGDDNGSASIAESVRNVFLIPQPRLGIQLGGKTNAVLFWATNFTAYTLQSSTNLNTNGWSIVSPGPAVSGTNYVVTNALSSSPHFYRLSK